MDKRLQELFKNLGSWVLAIFAGFTFMGDWMFTLLPFLLLGFIIHLIVMVVKIIKSVKNGQETFVKNSTPVQPTSRAGKSRVGMYTIQSTGIDYGARHRDNAKKMLAAGLITNEEYQMQLERSRKM